MYLILFILILGIILLVSMIQFKKYYFNKLVSYIENNNFDDFNLLINKWFIKFLFNFYTINTLKLNVAIMHNQEKEVKNLLKLLENKLTNQQQLANIYLQGFNYYVSIENKDAAFNFLKKIKTTNNIEMIKESSRVYNIYLDKNDKDLKELLEELKSLPDEKKGVNEFLISLIYKNKNDLKNQQKYEQLSKQHLALLDKQIKAKKGKQ